MLDVAVAPPLDYVTPMTNSKLEMFGHICRMPDNGLLKKVLFGMVEGHKYQGRPKKRRVDNNFILKWCNMTLQEKSHHAQNHVKWRTFIAGPYGS